MHANKKGLLDRRRRVLELIRRADLTLRFDERKGEWPGLGAVLGKAVADVANAVAKQGVGDDYEVLLNEHRRGPVFKNSPGNDYTDYLILVQIQATELKKSNAKLLKSEQQQWEERTEGVGVARFLDEMLTQDPAEQARIKTENDRIREQVPPTKG